MKDSDLFVAFLVTFITWKLLAVFDGLKLTSVTITLLVGVLVLGGVVLFTIAHYIERALDRLNMWRNGIVPDSKKMPLSYPFKPFCLMEYLQRYYTEGQNSMSTFIGLSAEHPKPREITIPDEQRCQHCQIIGITGSGKSESLFYPLIYQDALKGRPVIILDAKGELEAANRINALMKNIGRDKDFYLFSLTHKDISCSYNPIFAGDCDPQIIIDAFLNNFIEEHTFFRETSKTIFENTYMILYSLGKPFTVMDIYAYLMDEKCRLYVNDLIDKDNETGSKSLMLLNTLLNNLTQQYKGWQHVITGFGNYLLKHKDPIFNDGEGDIVLSDIIRNRKIVYFQLATNAYPLQAVSVARMVQANLRYLSSLIQSGVLSKDILVNVIIDEYGSLAEDSFTEVLNKARSSGMMVTIAHHSISDLAAVSESFMNRVDESTLNKIYLKQSDPKLCESIAKSLGTHTKWAPTYRKIGGRFGNQIHIGESSNRLVNEFNFSPDKIKSLHKYGQGYFVYKGDNTQECVNFGHFRELQKSPYKKKSKPEKQEGINLFEKYCQTMSEDVEDLAEQSVPSSGIKFDD